MDVVFNSRVQKIVGSQVPVNGSCAYAFDHSGDTNDLIETRGRIFCAYEVSSFNENEVGVLSNAIKDSILDTYFGSLDGTPIQALEKSLFLVRDKCQKLNAVVELSACVIWGKIIYTAFVGSAGAFLMRAGSIKNLREAQENDINVSSAILEKDDVVVIATGEFLKDFSGDDFVKSGFRVEEELSQKENKHKMAAVIIAFSQNETLNQVGEILKETNPKRKLGLGIFRKKEKLAVSNFEPDVIPITIRPQEELLTKDAPKSKKKPLKIKRAGMAVVFLGLIATSIAYGYNSIFKANKENVIKETPVLQVEAPIKEEDSALIDLKESNFLSSISSVDTYENNLVVLDSGQNKILILDEQNLTKDAITVLDTNSEIAPLGVFAYDARVYALLNDGLLTNKFLEDALEKEVLEESLGGEIKSFNVYLSNLYVLLQDNTIYKYSASSSGFAKSTWLNEGNTLEDSVDMAVDYYVYVLKKDGNVERFLSGNKEEFNLSADNLALNPKAIFAKDGTENIYVLDSTAKKVFIYDKKTGSFKKKVDIVAPAAAELIDVVANEVSNKLYIVSKTKLYEVPFN